MFDAILNHLSARMPVTVLGWVVHIACGMAASFSILTLMEHGIHRNAMHLKKFKFLYKAVPLLEWIQNEHAVLHHGVYYKQFDYEPDPEGANQNIIISWDQTIIMGFMTAPIILVLGYFSAIAAVIFMISGVAHNRAWNLFHGQMHLPKQVFWRNWGYYRFLGRHHFMHHQAPLKNFNVVLPGADFVMGTVAQPKLSDVREMLRLGYVLPRSQKAKNLLEGLKPQAGYTFAEPAQAPQLRQAA